jgi:Secretion system C-terminal sorting domain
MEKNPINYVLFFLVACFAHTSIFATNPENFAPKNAAAQAKFWENKGQIKTHEQKNADFVKYVYENKGLKIFLMEGGLAYQFEKLHFPEGYKPKNKFSSPAEQTSKEPIRLETYRMDMELVGANPRPRISQSGESADIINYYNHDVLNVQGYEKITYHEVYPGIDWVIYTTEEGLKYDFVARPQADISKIKMRFLHQEKLQLNPNGGFTLTNKMGSIHEQAPVSFQNGKTIQTNFKLSDNELSFSVAAYDPKQTLTIDPALEWATYYGGTDWESSGICAVDAAENVYLIGITYSTTAIAAGGHQQSIGGTLVDAFLAKFNRLGVRQWATYYGGVGEDRPYFCVVDALGNVYLGGKTNSLTNIAYNGYQNTRNGTQDGFLVKFNGAGVRQWATYYGGTNENEFTDAAMDGLGNIYISGSTNSLNNIATAGAHQTSLASFLGSVEFEAFLVKFNSAGVRQWATYYGGINTDYGFDCAVDASGNVFMSGNTISSSNIATTGAHQTGLATGGLFAGSIHQDAFLVKFNSAGVRQWGTYYGGVEPEFGYGCAADIFGNAYLTGGTRSTAWIAAGSGHQIAYGGGISDAFLVKFNSAGVRLWGTYYGGSDYDHGGSCVVDANGYVYVVGSTRSTGVIAFGGYQNAYAGGGDAFLVKFNAAGTREWGTYYGGSGGDDVAGCVLDANGGVYIAGGTSSLNGIALNGHQNTFGGNNDAFLAKFDCCQKLPIELVNFSPRCEQQAVICEWTTASETNNDYFTVEKSTDASQWQAVGTVKATGNSTSYKSYTFVDKNPANGSDGVGYYRLKQTDYDGQATYSGITSVNCELSEEILTFPNPVDKTLTVQGLKPNTILSIVNPQGVILNRTTTNNPTQILYFSEYPSGLYMLWLETKDAFVVKKVIKR